MMLSKDINRAKCMKKEMVNTLGSLNHEFIYNQTIMCDIGVEIWIIVCDMLGEGNGTPLQYSCLENPMDGGAWRAAVHGVTRSWTQVSDFTFTFHFHALEKEMATHSSVLALENPRDVGSWWAAVNGLAQSRTRLKRLSSSSSISLELNIW